MDTILKVENLIDLEGERIIENLSFEVMRGETVMIIGPNGTRTRGTMRLASVGRGILLQHESWL